MPEGPGSDRTAISDLVAELFPFVEAQVRRVVSGRAGAQVLTDYFPASLADAAELAIEGQLSFHFRSPSGTCNMSRVAATHWAELAVLLLRPGLDAWLQGHGWRFVENGLPTLEKVRERGGEWPLVELDGTLHCVVRGDTGSELMTDEGLPERRLEDLRASLKKRVLQVAAASRCACPFCRKIDAGRARRIDFERFRRRQESSRHCESLASALRRAKVVESLYLSDRNLEELPEEIGRLQRLRELNVSGNRLTTLPAVLGNLPALEWLCLTNNFSLRELPGELTRCPRLRRLDLGCTGLAELPAWLSEMPVLAELELSFALASPRYPTFPTVLKDLIELRMLSVFWGDWASDWESFRFDPFIDWNSCSCLAVDSPGCRRYRHRCKTVFGQELSNRHS